MIYTSCTHRAHQHLFASTCAWSTGPAFAAVYHSSPLFGEQGEHGDGRLPVQKSDICLQLSDSIASCVEGNRYGPFSILRNDVMESLGTVQES